MLDWLAWLAAHTRRHGKIEERVAEFAGLESRLSRCELLASLDHLHEFDRLQTCNRGCRRCEGWDDPSCLQLDRDPVHLLEAVGEGACISGCAYEVDVAVGVLVLLELVSFERGHFGSVHSFHEPLLEIGWCQRCGLA